MNASVRKGVAEYLSYCLFASVDAGERDTQTDRWQAYRSLTTCPPLFSSYINKTQLISYTKQVKLLHRNMREGLYCIKTNQTQKRTKQQSHFAVSYSVKRKKAGESRVHHWGPTEHPSCQSQAELLQSPVWEGE